MQVTPRWSFLVVLVSVTAGCPTPQPILPALTDGDLTGSTAASRDVTTGGSDGSRSVDSGTSSGPLPAATDATSSSTGSSSSSSVAEASSGDAINCALEDEGCVPDGADDPWTEPMWPYRRRVVVESPVNGPLVDFAVPVRLDETFEYRCTRPDGADLRFVDEAGDVLAHEIDQWHEDGASIVWVRLPTIDPGVEIPIWLYYGHQDASPSAGEVWPDTAALGTQAVFHFGEDLDDARGLHDGVPVSKIVMPQYTAQGVIGHAIHYEDILLGAEARLEGSDDIDDAILDRRALTVTAWIRATPNVASPSGFRSPVSRGSQLWSMVLEDRYFPFDFSNPTPAAFLTRCVEDGCGEIPDEVLVGANGHSLRSIAPVINFPAVAVWHHVAIVYEPIDPRDPLDYRKLIYIDGDFDIDETSSSLSMNWDLMESHLDSITIGAGASSPDSSMFHGDIDELHIASAVWDSERIRAEHRYGTQPEQVTVMSAQCR